MRNEMVTFKSAASASAAYRAIADPTRRRLLDVLLAGPASAGSLARRFSTSRPAIARHLAVLRRARLVSTKPRGRQRIYALRPNGLAPVSQWLAQHERSRG